jgi:CheY-like chemotaxis protein
MLVQPEPIAAQRAPILLAEDREDDLLLLKLAFERAGYNIPIVHVSNGAEALAYLMGQGAYADHAQYPFPRFLLLDLGLPGMSGFELLTRIRQTPQLQTLPVIVLTISAYSSDIRKAFSLGANSFMTKPANLMEMAASVRQLAEVWLGETTSLPGLLPPTPESQAGEAGSLNL